MSTLKKLRALIFFSLNKAIMSLWLSIYDQLTQGSYRLESQGRTISDKVNLESQVVQGKKYFS